MKRKYIYDLIIIVLLGLVFLYRRHYTPRSAIRAFSSLFTGGFFLYKGFDFYLAEWKKMEGLGHLFSTPGEPVDPASSPSLGPAFES